MDIEAHLITVARHISHAPTFGAFAQVSKQCARIAYSMGREKRAELLPRAVYEGRHVAVSRGRIREVRYHPDGSIFRIAHYIGGLIPDGPCEAWGRAVWRFYYINGEFDGRNYFEFDGAITISNYTRGQLIDRLTYRAGNLIKRITNIEGRLCERLESWHQNGVKMREIAGHDPKCAPHGCEQGSYKIWYSNGQICLSGSYQERRRHGVFEVWTKSGELCMTAEFSCGLPIRAEIRGIKWVDPDPLPPELDPYLWSEADLTCAPD